MKLGYAHLQCGIALFINLQKHPEQGTSSPQPSQAV